MLFFSMVALAAPPPGWIEQLGKVWVLTEGWTSMRMELRTPVPDLPADDWIGLVFQSDGTLTWQPLRAVDRSGGCSNAFAGFRGTWSVQSGQVRVQLIEQTFAEEYPNSMIVEAIEADRLILEPRSAR